MKLDEDLKVILNSSNLNEYAKGEAVWQRKKKICRDNHITSDTRLFLGSIVGVGDSTMGRIKYIMQYGTEEQKRRARKGGVESDGRKNQIWAIAYEIRDNNYALSQKQLEKPVKIIPKSEETRICKVCGQEKPITNFVVANGKYRINTCNNCRWLKQKQKNAEKKLALIKPKEEIVDTEKTRICKECGQELPIDKFELSKGYRLRVCRVCRSRKYRNKDFKNNTIESQDIAMTEKELNDYLYNADNEIGYTIDDLVEEILINGKSGIKSVETSLEIHNDLLTTEENKQKIIESLKTLSHRLYKLQLRFKEN